MRLFIKTLKTLLGLWTIIGASYMIQNYDILRNEWASQILPDFFWIILAIVEIFLAIGIILSCWGKFKKLTIPCSSILAIINFAGIFIYTGYEGVSGSLWGIIPALLFCVIIIHHFKTSK